MTKKRGYKTNEINITVLFEGGWGRGGGLYIYTQLPKRPNMVHRLLLNKDPVQAIHHCPVTELHGKVMNKPCNE